jgi:hypothetical protein
MAAAEFIENGIRLTRISSGVYYSIGEGIDFLVSAKKEDP